MFRARCYTLLGFAIGATVLAIGAAAAWTTAKPHRAHARVAPRHDGSPALASVPSGDPGGRSPCKPHSTVRVSEVAPASVVPLVLLDCAGRPVAGCTVDLSNGDLARLETDNNGRTTVFAPYSPGTRVLLDVTTEPNWWRRIEVTTKDRHDLSDTVVVLPRPVHFSVNIRDSGGQAVLSNARHTVHASMLDCVGSGDGTVRLRAPGDLEQLFTIRADGYAHLVRRWKPRQDATYNVILSREAVLTGLVEDATGAPARGRVSCDGRYYTLDRSGRYRIDQLRAGRHKLTVRVAAGPPLGEYPWSVRLVKVIEGEEVELPPIRLASAGLVSGRVTSPNGQAAPETWVVALSHSLGMVAVTATDSAGEFQVSIPVGATVRLAAARFPRGDFTARRSTSAVRNSVRVGDSVSLLLEPTRRAHFIPFEPEEGGTTTLVGWILQLPHTTNDQGWHGVTAVKK